VSAIVSLLVRVRVLSGCEGGEERRSLLTWALREKRRDIEGTPNLVPVAFDVSYNSCVVFDPRVARHHHRSFPGLVWKQRNEANNIGCVQI